MKERINMTIPPDVLRELDDICANSGYTRSLVILRALKFYFAYLQEVNDL